MKKPNEDPSEDKASKRLQQFEEAREPRESTDESCEDEQPPKKTNISGHKN